jgi:hypothetical protein
MSTGYHSSVTSLKLSTTGTITTSSYDPTRDETTSSGNGESNSLKGTLNTRTGHYAYCDEQKAVYI